jgi:hypothetical protein
MMNERLKALLLMLLNLRRLTSPPVLLTRLMTPLSSRPASPLVRVVVVVAAAGFLEVEVEVVDAAALRR